jgi:Family of unknown function (DUF6152)
MRKSVRLAGAALMMLSGSAIAHHSFAMFDQEHPVEIVGTITEFKYSSPHVYIFIDAKGPDGAVTNWNLEGGAPSLLVREGWSSKSLKPGDEVRMTIDPLRSGAPGGAFQANRIKFSDGRPIATPK